METQTQTQSKFNQRRIIILLLLLLTLLGVVLAVVIFRGNSENISDNATPLIGYATDAKVFLDQDSLQAAMDEAMANAKDGNIGLYYQNDATSNDGINFDCFIGNSSANAYDMFLTIFADAEMTDQIFLSQLVPPGSGFEQVTLEHALDPGVHRVYVALTQVETNEETGEQVLKGQVVHTMDFHVNS